MFSTLIPTPKPLQVSSSSYDLKERLDWGEPALTIIDIRSREMFNECHISGAVSAPIHELISVASENLEHERDIYVYGESDEQAAEAASVLRKAGFNNVAQLRDGLSGWKAIKGATE